jgi:hypothetical protein
MGENREIIKIGRADLPSPGEDIIVADDKYPQLAFTAIRFFGCFGDRSGGIVGRYDRTYLRSLTL